MSGILVAPTFVSMVNLRDVNDAAKADQYGLVWDAATSKHVYVDIVVPADLSSYLSTADIDTLAELNAIVADDTIIGAAATDASSFGFVVDEDNLASDLDTKVPTQQSVKAYVDGVISGLTALEAEDIDTLAEINAILGDATLVTVEATDASGYGWVIDEDDMTSDSATKVPTQQSVKAYVDAEIAGVGGGSGGLTVTAKTAGYTAANGDLVVCDSSGGAFNVTMPASPTADERIGIYLEDGSAASAVTVQGNGKVLAEFGTAVTLQTPGDVIVFQYDGSKWVIESNGIQVYSLSLLAAGSIDEDADYIRIADGDATEDHEKRVTVKSLGGPYIEDSTLGTAAGDIVYRPTANDHWTNLPAGEDAGLGGVPNFPIASQAEAEAGTAENRLMNPLRTAQAIAALETGGGSTLPVVDSTAIVKGSVDATKLVRFEVDGLTTGTTRVLAVQDADGTIELTGHTHATTDITSGTFADARIAASNVTQHESALTITVSQISDFGSYAAASHTHAASDITGTLAHEQGGLEADISTIAIGDIVAGTGTGTVGIVTATGHSDGDVLTIQADGSVDFETPATGPFGDGDVIVTDGSSVVKVDFTEYSGSSLTGWLRPYTTGATGNVYFRLRVDGHQTSDPDQDDDVTGGYTKGSRYFNTSTGQFYHAADVTDGAAVWRQVSLNGGIQTLTDGVTVTVDASFGANQRVTLGGNRSLAFSNFKTGQKVCLRLTQDGTGSRTVTWPSSGVTINWAGGSAPTLTTTASKADWVVIVCTDESSGAEVYDAAVAMANV